MRHFLSSLIGMVLLLGVAATGVAAEPAATGKRVFVLPIEGPIDKGMLYVFRRAFREAENTSPAAIVIELNTPGGAIRDTQEIISWIRSQQKRCPVYAFVNPEAISAGAMISLSTKAIYMAPTSSIGDAMPILMTPGGGIQELDDDHKEKMRSYIRGMVRGLAQENGYSEDLAEAMVDPDKEFTIGDTVVCPKGKLLTLTSKEAIRVIPPRTTPLLATAIVEDLPELLEKVGLANAQVVRFEEEKADRLARWITLFGPILFSLGMIGIFIEMRTPGFGLPGIAGGICLGIYFFGHYVAGLAGWEDMALIMVGLVLLALEIFVIPGFGIAGISGIACIVIGAFMALIPHLPTAIPLEGVDLPGQGRYVDAALRNLLISFVLIGLLAWLASRILPRTRLYSALVLEGGLSNADGYVASDVERYRTFLGQEGVARTMLRPSGSAVFGDERLDVVTSGDLVPKGSRVRVIRVEGGRVVVERVEDSAKGA